MNKIFNTVFNLYLTTAHINLLPLKIPLKSMFILNKVFRGVFYNWRISNSQIALKIVLTVS